MHTHAHSPLPFPRRSEMLVELEQKDAAEAKADQLRKIERKCKSYAELLAKIIELPHKLVEDPDCMNVCIKADRCERLPLRGKTGQSDWANNISFLVSLLVTVPVLRSPRMEDLPAQRNHFNLSTTIF